MRGCDVTRSCTAAEKTSRSTVSALPPGTRAASAHSRIMRAEQAHLGLEQAVRVGGLGALEGVRADELREPIGLVRFGAADGPHLVHDDVVPALGELPGGLAAGESAADDVDGGHGENLVRGCGAAGLRGSGDYGRRETAATDSGPPCIRSSASRTPHPLAALVGRGAESYFWASPSPSPAQ